MIKPKQLRKGDTVAVISPSGGAAAKFRSIYDGGVQFIEHEYGLKIEEYPTVRMNRDELYQNPKIRAKDVNDAFADAEVKGIIASIGGSDSVRILQYLDIDIIMKNPKKIMGYSDSTAFLSFLNIHGLVTYYGPSVMAGFAYLKNFPDARSEYQNVLFGNKIYEIKAFPKWADEYKSWMEIENIGEVKEIYEDRNEHRWINKGKTTTGRLWGGCIEILEMMNGTFAWPIIDFFDDIVLLIETSEEKPTPDHIGYVLRNFGLQGILNRIQGLLLAKPKAYSDNEKAELEDIVKRTVVDEWGRKDLKIIANMDFGHTEPRHIMPYGINLEIDPKLESISFIDNIYA